LKYAGLFILFLLCPVPLSAQSDGSVILKADSLKTSTGIELDKLPWRYHPGDDLRWAGPQFDDSSWEVLTSAALRPATLPQSGWNGIGWFRLHVQIDPELADEPLDLLVQHWGASEFYLDGKLIRRFGVIGTSEQPEQEFDPRYTPVGLTFNGAGEHLIAVRHSLRAIQDANTGLFAGFLRNIKLRQLNSSSCGLGFVAAIKQNAAFEHETNVKTTVSARFGAAGLVLALGLLHLFLFWRYPRLRANLYFSLFGFSLALWYSLITLRAFSHYGLNESSLLSPLVTLFAQSTLVSMLAFLYTVLVQRVPRHYWIFFSLAAFNVLLSIVSPSEEVRFWAYTPIFVLFFAEGVRLVAQAFREKHEGAWIFGLSLVLVIPLVIFVVLARPGVVVSWFIELAVTLTYLVGVTLIFSFYLARQFVRTHQEKLEQQRAAAELKLQHEQEKSRRELMEKEVALAADIQKGFISGETPNHRRLRRGCLEPARTAMWRGLLRRDHNGQVSR